MPLVDCPLIYCSCSVRRDSYAYPCEDEASSDEDEESNADDECADWDIDEVSLLIVLFHSASFQNNVY